MSMETNPAAATIGYSSHSTKSFGDSDGAGFGWDNQTVYKIGAKHQLTYGGKPDDKKMNMDVDYLMHASDKDWACMGKGSWRNDVWQAKV